MPDTVYDALEKLLPDTVPAEGAGCLNNFQLSMRPVNGATDGTRAEVLTFSSGGSGARPTLDGMRATAFPSGVMTMPVEVTEQVGPVMIWRKELRPDSGSVGSRRGSQPGAATTIARDDDAPIKGKGKPFVPQGCRVRMAFPGGAGYGGPATPGRERRAPRSGAWLNQRRDRARHTT